VVFEDPAFQEWIEELSCMVCGGGENDDLLLLCDGERLSLPRALALARKAVRICLALAMHSRCCTLAFLCLRGHRPV
jgi:hypothetical protein